MIKSELYSISAGVFAKILFSDFSRHYMLFGLIVGLALIILSFIDIRWFIILLMVLFIIIPMLVSYLYIWHCLKPEVRWSVLQKYIIVDGNGIQIVYDDDKCQQLEWNVFSKCKLTDKYYIFTFSKSKYLYFVVPVDSIADIHSYIPKQIDLQIPETE